MNLSFIHIFKLILKRHQYVKCRAVRYETEHILCLKIFTWPQKMITIVMFLKDMIGLKNIELFLKQ